MIEVRIADRREIRPGRPIRVRIDWSLARAPERVDVRLLLVSKAGEHDEVKILAEAPFVSVERAGSRECVLDAPSSPWSYEGALVTLRFVIEAVATPGGDVREEIVVSPTGRPLRSHALTAK